MEIRIVTDKQSNGSDWKIKIDKSNDIIFAIRKEIYQYLKKRETHFLIHKNIILRDKNLISLYKICPDDEIWWGKIENYLKCDDVIVDVFLPFWPCGLFINLILNTGKSIADVRSILNGILFDIKIIDIWNDRGELMENNQLISEIDTNNRERRLFCRLKYEDIDRSSDKCCDFYDRYLADYLWRFRYYLSLCNKTWTDEDKKQIQILGEMILSIVPTDGTFDDNLASMARCLQNSRFLCCTSIVDRICEALFDGRVDYWSLAWEKCKNKYGHKFGVWDKSQICKFQYYFRSAMYTLVLDYVTRKSSLDQPHRDSISSQHHSFISIRIIMQDASNRYLKNYVDIKQYLLSMANKLFMKPRDDSWLMLMAHDKPHPILQLQVPNQARGMCPQDTITIRAYKKEISIQTGTPPPLIYIIDSDQLLKPKDEDTITDSDTWRLEYVPVKSTENIYILKTIDRGSYGEILLCQDKGSQDLFALKKPFEAGNLDREIITHSIISKDSSDICRHRGLFNYQGTICSAMDYKSGGTLDEFIKRRKCLQEPEIARISLQILIQIKDMHRHGVIHRDIKPDNIVLDENDKGYLIDFGISKFSHDMVHGESIEIENTSSPGTAHYMAPELASGDLVTEKIDTWSFGVVVIEMVNGLRPYHNLPDSAVKIKIVKERKINFELSASVTKELKDFINSCVEPDPNKRATIDGLIQSPFITKYCRQITTKV